MSFINQLLTGTSISHSIFILAIIVAIGLALGKIKIFGISLGVTWVLFIGIFLGHFGFTVDEKILNFVKDFGLILFVYFIGLQVGPSFFASLKKKWTQIKSFSSNYCHFRCYCNLYPAFDHGLTYFYYDRHIIWSSN